MFMCQALEGVCRRVRLHVQRAIQEAPSTQPHRVQQRGYLQHGAAAGDQAGVEALEEAPHALARVRAGPVLS